MSRLQHNFARIALFVLPFSLFTFPCGSQASRKPLASVSRARQGRATPASGPAPRVERNTERRLEDAASRPRMVVTRHQQRTRLDDDIGRGSRQRVAARAGDSTSRPVASCSTSKSSGCRTPISRTRRTVMPHRRRSSRATASTCTSAARARRRSTPRQARSSGRRNFRMHHSTAAEDRRRFTETC